jgi:hypothetical protein
MFATSHTSSINCNLKKLIELIKYHLDEKTWCETTQEKKKHWSYWKGTRKTSRKMNTKSKTAIGKSGNELQIKYRIYEIIKKNCDVADAWILIRIIHRTLKISNGNCENQKITLAYPNVTRNVRPSCRNYEQFIIDNQIVLQKMFSLVHLILCYISTNTISYYQRH